MDYIHEMSSACEGTMDALALGIPLALLIGGYGTLGVLYHYERKRNAKKVAHAQNEYFEIHEIPEKDRPVYSEIIRRDARAFIRDAFKKWETSADGKATIEAVKRDIISGMNEYLSEGELDVNKLRIKIGPVYDKIDDHIHFVEVTYHGPGFTTYSHVWDIGEVAGHPIAVKFGELVKAKYAEEIQCKFISPPYIDDKLAYIAV